MDNTVLVIKLGSNVCQRSILIHALTLTLGTLKFPTIDTKKQNSNCLCLKKLHYNFIKKLLSTYLTNQENKHSCVKIQD